MEENRLKRDKEKNVKVVQAKTERFRCSEFLPTFTPIEQTKECWQKIADHIAEVRNRKNLKFKAGELNSICSFIVGRRPELEERDNYGYVSIA